MTQIIIPISIDSPFFPKEDYYFPKPLVSVNNKPLIILSGIGQEVLKDLFKDNNVQLLASYFKSKKLLNKKLATYHAPAACIAGLLAEVIE